MDKKNLSILAVSMGSGGAEKVLSLILPELVKKYHVRLFLLYDIFHFSVPEGVEIILLGASGTSSKINKILHFPKAVLKVLSIYRKHPPDVSISFLIRPNFINCIAKMRYPKIKTILSERCFPSSAYKLNPWVYRLYKKLIPFLFNKADYLFSNSKFINQDLEESFGVKIPMGVIYNPVIIPPKEEVKKSKNTNVKIVSVGKFHQVKNQGLAIKSVKNLPFNYILQLIGGGGDYKDFLEQEVKEEGLNRTIEFTGKITNVWDYLWTADMYIMPSSSEGFPNALLEAMGAGLQIVTTDCISGPREMFGQPDTMSIDKGTFLKTPFGLMTPIKDHLAMEKALIYLYEFPEEAAQMGVNASERAKEYSLDAFVIKLESIL